MIISFDNKSIVEYFTEVAKLIEAAGRGSNINIAVGDNNNFEENDFIIVGSMMNPKAEIAQINAPVIYGHTVQVDSLTFGHNPNETIHKLIYNKVFLYTATSETGGKSLIKERQIDVDQRFTDFVLPDNTNGFAYFKLVNTQTLEETEYSAPIALEDLSNKNFSAIKNLVETHYKDYDLEAGELRTLVFNALEQIYAIRSWRFKEAITTFNTVDGQREYDIIEDLQLDDFGKMVSVRMDNEPLQIITSEQDDLIAMGGRMFVGTISEFAGKFFIDVNGAKTITMKYYKNPKSLFETNDKTDVPLTSAIAYFVLSELYVTRDTELSDRFNARYLAVIKKMENLDDKNIEINTLSGGTTFRQRTPNIISD